MLQKLRIFSCEGYVWNYTTWTWHGKLFDSTVDDPAEEIWLKYLISVFGAKSFVQAVYETMFRNVESSLYLPSTKFTVYIIVNDVKVDEF